MLRVGVMPVIPEPSVARQVFHAVVQLASHASQAQRYFANLPLPDTSVSASHHRAVQLLNLLLVKYRCPCLSLNQLAHDLEVSAPHLSELLRRASGYGFGTHLSGVRVLSAALLLVGNHASIAGIAHQCGYTQTAVLDRQFRQWLHASPTRFRRIVRRSDTPQFHNVLLQERMIDRFFGVSCRRPGTAQCGAEGAVEGGLRARSHPGSAAAPGPGHKAR